MQVWDQIQREEKLRLQRAQRFAFSGGVDAFQIHEPPLQLQSSRIEIEPCFAHKSPVCRLFQQVEG